MATALELSNTEIRGMCQSYLHQNDLTANFEIISYQLQPVSEAPAGFLGSHFYLQVILRLQETGELKQLRLFCKSAPVGNVSHMEYVEDFSVFQKEISVYQHVLPDVQAACTEIAPKCYYADKNLLVFENLIDQGYRMGADRDGLLNYEQLHCCLKTLAAMHAGSIIKDHKKKPQIPLEENAYPSNVPPENLRLVNFNQACEVLKEFIKMMPKYQSQLDYILANFTQRMSSIFELVKTSKTRLNVLLHGDLWANNILFQYGKYGENPLQCRFVDFQLARYAAPVIDLITVLTIPTTSQFREAHLSELLAEYYRFMTEFLKRAGLNISDFMTEAEYYDSVEEYRIVGLIESCLFCHLVIMPTTCTQDLTGTADGFSDFFSRKRIDICLKAFNTDEIYRSRMQDMLEDFIDHFILQSS
ncbi:uncharacterized protein LOC6562174 [Drosophila grimshawi]|uniref:GH10406 n=1 Tax=Drosophila grimshawi TaxID=7222 RepID=B4JE98_DROGR|nr:uncharacterized protein LOC6562174 [Drosophila grimshawi]EDW03618.1 GH10406 [Drosophila grimshawi]